MHQEGEFDLTLEVIEEAVGARCCVKYAPDLFEAGTVERFTAHYRNLLRAALGEPERPVAGLDLLTPTELEGMLAGNPRDYPRDRTTWDLVRERIAQHPDGLALVDAHGPVTYAEPASTRVPSSA